jgi:hypothetical protein
MDVLTNQGWLVVGTGVAESSVVRLRDSVFAGIETGRRCLLDHPEVAAVARVLRSELIAAGHLAASASAIQAIAFEKNPSSNWKVTWHQDLMFPLERAASAPGYDLACVKGGVAYARPPREVLENLLAVRLHLDDCDERNGPLRVLSGTHLNGVLTDNDIEGAKTRVTESVCLASVGEALLLRPLLLHASSPALEPRHRRVLHVVYHSGAPVREPWFRAVGV